ncbi:hypothetical protein ACEPPN_005835 [Leptodophora sp. 'Broadleaf-Isolate-01']
MPSILSSCCLSLTVHLFKAHISGVYIVDIEQMDPLTRPRPNTTLQPIKTPYVCSERELCKGEDFFIWTNKQKLSQLPLEEFAAELQAWLYFGLLSAFLGRMISPEEVVVVDPDQPGRKIVNTDFVYELIRGKRFGREKFWSTHSRMPGGYAKAVTVDYPARQSSRDSVLLACRAMNDIVIDYLSNQSEDADLWTSEPYAVIFAIDLLIDSMEAVLWNSLQLADVKDLERRSLTANVRTFRDSIAKTGRCRSLAWRLQPTSSEWYRLLLLPRFEKFNEHADCQYGSCTLHNIDPLNYETKHLDTCDGCGFVQSDQDILVECIENDQIPLICCYEDPDGILKITTVKGSLQSNYTAISHVWSGGLGNFKENAIPQCQLRQLVEMIEALPEPPARAFESFEMASEALEFFEDVSGNFVSWASTLKRRPVLFWLDTLCIPVATKYKDKRKLAIDSMAQLYAGARKVLVLDPYLQLLPSKSVGLESTSLAMHIKISPWMARSWPLQEGALARNLYVKLLDRTTLLAAELFYDTIGLPAVRMLDYNPGVLSSSADSLPSKFRDVWNGLINRNTTQPADVHGIFATMVNLSPKEILALPENERMKAIIKAQFEIPLAVLYQPSSGNDGAWSPQFPNLATGADFLFDRYGVLLVTDEGFTTKDLGSTFALLMRGHPPPSESFVLQPKGSSIQYRINTKSQQSTSSLSSLPSGLPETPPDSPETLFLLSRVCSGIKPGYQGACFSVKSKSETGIQIRFKSVVSWSSNFESTLSGLSEGTETVCEYLRETRQADYKILISLDIKSWHKPTWLRNEVFPFSILNFNYITTWMISAVIALILTWAPGYFVQMGGIRETFSKFYRWNYWEYSLGVFIYSNFWVLRCASLLLEIAFWTRWLTEFAEQRWAASFYDSSLSKRLLDMQNPPLLITLPTHTPFFVLGIILLGFWIKFRTAWLLWSAGTFIVEPFLRLIIQATVQGYGMGVYNFVLHKVLRPNKLRWIIHAGVLFVFIITSVRITSYGEQFQTLWVDWLGRGVLYAYPGWLGLDWYGGFSRSWALSVIGDDDVHPFWTKPALAKDLLVHEYDLKL